MMLYTTRAASHYMRDPEDMLELAIERVNDTFHNSGLGNISLRLVHTQAVDYDEHGSEQFNDLYRMVDGEGPFKDIRRLRDEKHADVVGLLVDDPRGCGLSTRVAPDSEEAYFVVHYACAAVTISIAHEIGHLLLNLETHSATGIMRGDWDLRDLQGVATGFLLFTPQQAEIIRTEVARRASRPDSSRR